MTAASDRPSRSRAAISGAPPSSPDLTGASVASSVSNATQQCLSFQLSNDLHALLPIQQLTEVLNLPISQIVPIPDVPPAVVGVANWRGEVLWLVDLGYSLGAKPLLAQGYCRSKYTVLVAHHQDCPIGLLVDRVTQMLWIDPAQVQAMPSSPQSATVAPYVEGYWLTPNQETLLVLEAAALVSQFH